ncbi:MAG: M67 family metallopeptidase [Deinococcales bacterium]
MKSINLAACYQDLILEAKKHYPYECVGLIFSDASYSDHIASRYLALNNIAPEPKKHYNADPSQLLTALTEADDRQEKLIAIYHSHPKGPATPSASDLKHAHYPVIYLIILPLTAEIFAYTLRDEVFTEVKIQK